MVGVSRSHKDLVDLQGSGLWGFVVPCQKSIADEILGSLPGSPFALPFFLSESGFLFWLLFWCIVSHLGA